MLYSNVTGLTPVTREIKKLYTNVTSLSPVTREIKELWAHDGTINRRIFNSSSEYIPYEFEWTSTGTVQTGASSYEDVSTSGTADSFPFTNEVIPYGAAGHAVAPKYAMIKCTIPLDKIGTFNHIYIDFEVNGDSDVRFRMKPYSNIPFSFSANSISHERNSGLNSRDYFALVDSVNGYTSRVDSKSEGESAKGSIIIKILQSPTSAPTEDGYIQLSVNTATVSQTGGYKSTFLTINNFVLFYAE